jgi:hypothetical protein
MKLRPRYSLLTLLVATALVAGGVKLWHGPHHVVEPDGQNWEKEYRYTRSWRGDRLMHGPVIRRQFEGEQLVCFDVSYFRQGVDTYWGCGCYLKPDRHKASIVRDDGECPLSEQELFALHQTRDTELQRLAAAGIRYEFQYEGELSFTFFLSCER